METPTSSPRSMSKSEMERWLFSLSERNALTSRDLQLLEYLSDLTVLSLDQIQRLAFNDASRETVRKRLSRLSHSYRLINRFHIPKYDMETRRLTYSKVYYLERTGHFWLVLSEQYPGRAVKREQAIHDLLVAELRVRLEEARRKGCPGWTINWYGEYAARFFRHQKDDLPLLVPDALAVIRYPSGNTPSTFAFFLEADVSREGHGRPSSRIQRKISGYDTLFTHRENHELTRELACFPAVLFITSGEGRLQNLAEVILRHRREPIGYALALWSDLLTSPNWFEAPAWMLLPPGSPTAIGRARSERQALLGHPGWLEALQQASPAQPQPAQPVQANPAPVQPVADPSHPPQKESPAPVNSPLPSPPKQPATPAQAQQSTGQSEDLEPIDVIRRQVNQALKAQGRTYRWLGVTPLNDCFGPALTSPAALLIVSGATSNLAYLFMFDRPRLDWERQLAAFRRLNLEIWQGVASKYSCNETWPDVVIIGQSSTRLLTVGRTMVQYPRPCRFYLAASKHFEKCRDVFVTPFYYCVYPNVSTFQAHMRSLPLPAL